MSSSYFFCRNAMERENYEKLSGKKISDEDFEKRKLVPTKLTYEDKYPSSSAFKQSDSIEFLKNFDFKTGKSMKKKTIYFAHSFNRWESKREEMITKILEERGYNVINPFVEEVKLNEKYKVRHYYERPTRDFAKEIVEKDRQMVLECDEYFGWFSRDMMIGTPIELIWAYNAKKPITVICWKPHPFLWMLSDNFYLGYDDFVKDIKFV